MPFIRFMKNEGLLIGSKNLCDILKLSDIEWILCYKETPKNNLT